MSNALKCSIITVAYNSDKTIEKTIQSVLNQTYENIEYILIDGASTDNTVEIIKKYEPSFGGKMRWISEPDDGIYYAMNKGISMATGDIIGIINSDDFYEEDAVENVISKVDDSNKKLIIYGMMRLLRNGIEDNISIYSPHFLENRSIAHPSCFISKKLYEEDGGYDTEFVSAADYDFFLRMKKVGDVEFVPVYNVLANFSAGGMCSTSKAYLDLLKVKRKHGLITEKEYKKLITKSKIYDFIHRKK